MLFFSADSFLIGVPTGIKIFAWLATMWGGRLRLKTPMLFAIGHHRAVHHRRAERHHAGGRSRLTGR